MVNKILFGRHQWCSARPYPTGLRFCALRTALMRLGLLRYLTSSSALHPILLCIPFSKLLGGVIWGGLLREMLFHLTCASLGFAWGYCVKNLIENEKKD